MHLRGNIFAGLFTYLCCPTGGEAEFSERMRVFDVVLTYWWLTLLCFSSVFLSRLYSSTAHAVNARDC